MFRLSMAVRGVQLGWVSVQDLGLSEERSHWHSNSGGPDLETVLRSMGISAEDAALDLGCGMGGAMITLASFPFNRVDGVEISPGLVQVAQRNLNRLGIAGSRVFQSDAADFQDYDPYSFIYMYNPFPRVVMKAVLRNLCDSQQRRPRTITLIYKAADAEDLVLESRFHRARKFDHCQPAFVVYISDPHHT